MSDKQIPNFNKFQIKKLNINDLDSISEVHLASFPESALTILGKKSVFRYYHWQFIAPHELYPIGVFTGNNLVAFCIGGIIRGAMGPFIRKNKYFLILQVLLHPWILRKKVIRTRFSIAKHALRLIKIKPASQPSVFNQVRSYSILSIAVHPEFQRNGLGKMLMDEAEQIAIKNNFEEMDLTVHVNNEKAINFYIKLGWQKYIEVDNWIGQMTKRIKY